MHLILNPCRISINPTLLQSSAKDILKNADSLASLQKALGWSEFPEYLAAGFSPQKDAKDLLRKHKDYRRRQAMKTKRQADGWKDFQTPRKGFKGWIQKKFFDPKELALPVGADLIEWLQASPRYQLLCVLHDSILGLVSTAEPKHIKLQESLAFLHPFASMLSKNDTSRIERLADALGSKLKDVPSSVLLDDVAGYVVAYSHTKNLAFYYSE
jgi:hypothetical protein